MFPKDGDFEDDICLPPCTSSAKEEDQKEEEEGEDEDTFEDKEELLFLAQAFQLPEINLEVTDDEEKFFTLLH